MLILHPKTSKEGFFVLNQCFTEKKTYFLTLAITESFGKIYWTDFMVFLNFMHYWAKICPIYPTLSKMWIFLKNPNQAQKT